ncbi:fimbrial protein [Mixta gaviniae]|uniref:Ferrous iron transporter B n=1 Tax=Mixta gaviniae TaxID=665914 RepID=A0A1X1EAV5_9GAMM|nr:fimbrial protein [Mixta gaviniae]AUX92162.1 ferrous iron transporter B [Mixta gaviniae]ORM85884.1 hypothetical protein HA44_03430 [Mixta gaviniae]
MKRFNQAALAMALLFSSASALAYDGTVNFNGEIIDNTCIISLGNGSNSLVVPMGSVNKSSFTGTGSIASTTQFALVMTNCPAVNASVKFDGPTYEGDQNVLALNPGAGVATGVGIQLYDKDMAALPLFTASNPYQLKEGEDNIMRFYASYIAMAGSVTAGPANAVATFTVNYN